TAAWKSQAKKPPDFSTFPQLLLLDIEMAKTDTSLANKTGHFNLLITSGGQKRFLDSPIPTRP
ncbi:MAG TPA: hypothetical protein VGO56_16965, partial [Pyrinomonadaceae bacterium]|nr:hypothetical protein [Pyrinomonadaceae bacterium]